MDASWELYPKLTSVHKLRLVGQVQLDGQMIQSWRHSVVSCRVRAFSGLAPQPDQPPTLGVESQCPLLRLKQAPWALAEFFQQQSR